MAAEYTGGAAPVPPNYGATPTSSSDGLEDQYVDLFQLAANRMADLVQSTVAIVTAHPLLAAGAAAASLGFLAGHLLAGSGRRPEPSLVQQLRPSKQVASGVVQAIGRTSAGRTRLLSPFHGTPLGIWLRLMQNPLVRALVLRGLVRALTRRLG